MGNCQNNAKYDDDVNSISQEIRHISLDEKKDKVQQRIEHMVPSDISVARMDECWFNYYFDYVPNFNISNKGKNNRYNSVSFMFVNPRNQNDRKVLIYGMMLNDDELDKLIKNLQLNSIDVCEIQILHIIPRDLEDKRPRFNIVQF